MEHWLVDNQLVIRGYVFYGMLAVMLLWESLKPAKYPVSSTPKRWFTNGCLLILDNWLLRLVFPLFAVLFAVYIDALDFGLFNLFEPPVWLALPLVLLALDFTSYLIHRLLHSLSWLWRLHKIHHADLDYDATTGLRFHPLESLVTVGATLLMIALLGAPPAMVVIYEALFFATALFNHGNIHLPPKLDNLLRIIFVTPDMHRVHHSIEFRESNANFSGIFSLWDRLFKTYCKEPAAGQDAMVMGLPEFRNESSVNLYRLLIMPFVSNATSSEPISKNGAAQPGNTSS